MAMMPKSGVSEAAADGGPEMQLVAVAKAGRIRTLVLCNQTDERMVSYKEESGRQQSDHVSRQRCL
jgi:hypothetical protein